MTKKNNNGFTLIEVLLALALISMVIIISTNLVIFATKTHNKTTKQYELQSSIRQATEKINKIVRYSKAVFAVPETFTSSTDKMDPGWDYFMVSEPDRNKIVSMEYDGDTKKHEENIIVPAEDNIIYKMFFTKSVEFDDEGKRKGESESMMSYKIYAYTIDNEGNEINEKLFYESTVESTNAVQVVDKGTEASPSIALAYRNDGKTSGKGKNQIAYISIIVDISGSMNELPDGTGGSNNEKVGSRIRRVRKALAGTENDRDEGIIQRFAKEENVFISLIPFSTTANYPNPSSYKEADGEQPIYEVYKEEDEEKLVSRIDLLKAFGGTNTGDGVRQAYNLHNDFRTKKSINEKDQVHHYMIMLVDGKSTYETKEREWVDNGEYEERGIFGKYEVWLPNGKVTESYYTKGGNIDIKLEDGPRSPYKEPNVPWLPDYGKKYGSKNEDIEYIAISGDGSESKTNLNKIGSNYIDYLGTLIQGFENGNGIKSYIIGYATDLSAHIDSIGLGIGTEEDNIYGYDDDDFDLEEIFKNIANDIMADFWIVSGPQIQK